MSNIPPYKTLDPRVQRTIDLLYKAFTDLLKEKHYRYIKVQEITKCANLNRDTFYNHFENMGEFIIFCTREGFRRELNTKYSITNLDYNKNNFISLVSWVLEFMSTAYMKWRYQWDEVLFEKGLRIEFYFFLTEWLINPNKYKDQPLFGDTCALLVSSSIIGLGMVWCSNGCIEPVGALSDQITKIFASGLPGLAN